MRSIWSHTIGRHSTLQAAASESRPNFNDLPDILQQERGQAPDTPAQRPRRYPAAIPTGAKPQRGKHHRVAAQPGCASMMRLPTGGIPQKMHSPKRRAGHARPLQNAFHGGGQDLRDAAFIDASMSPISFMVRSLV